jgi:hypothetical protein
MTDEKHQRGFQVIILCFRWDAPLVAQLPDINKIVEDFVSLRTSSEREEQATSEKKSKKGEQKAKKQEKTEKPEKSEDELKETEEQEERERRAEELRKSLEEKEEFQPGPRITEADLKNDMRSLYR